MSAGSPEHRVIVAAGGSDGGDREEPPGTTASMALSWRKSSWSAYNGNCVEVGTLRDGRVAVRDTKKAGCGPTLVFGAEAWGSFLASLKKGDLPG